MKRHIDRFDKHYKFPYEYDEKTPHQIFDEVGLYYVLDLVSDHDVVSELFMYVRSHLPRVHSEE